MYYLGIDPGSINFAYCLIDSETCKISKWDVVSIASSTHEGTCKKMAEELQKIEIPGPFTVIIESQPTCNKKTLVIVGQIEMYFTIEKMNGGDIDKIITYHARNKLKYYKPVEGDAPIVLKCKKGYYHNKRLSVEHSKRLLPRKDPDWISFFEGHKKKDDLSDSYLMTLSYIDKL